MKHTFTIMLICVVHLAFTQDGKIEKEQQVESSEVPKIAFDRVSKNFPEQKIKWFKELSDKGISFEAKFQNDDHFFSIEFSRDGDLQDTEITVRFDEVHEKVKSNLISYFDENYTKHKILKVQLRFNQPITEVINYWENPLKSTLLPQFEIEYIGKNESKNLWEGEFDSKGNLISKRKVITKSSDTLSY